MQIFYCAITKVAHNVFTDSATLSKLAGSQFLLIPGEELTTAFMLKPVHVNGLNIPGKIDPKVDVSLVGTIQKNVDAVRAVNGVPHINHPNFKWAISLAAGREIYGIAVDDAHHFQGEFAPGRSNPGRGWVVVRAGNLDNVF